MDTLEVPQLLQVNLFYYEHIQCVHTKKGGSVREDLAKITELKKDT